MSDFPDGILSQAAHRPWPLPNEPWIMTQSWHDLLFAHWPVDVAALRSKVPRALELDLFDHQAWLGIVPFRMTNVAPRGVPALPWVSAFPELNVRSYVRVGDKPGVYFLSLDAGNPLAVAAARLMFGLPYFQASMDVASDGDWVRYKSKRMVVADLMRSAPNVSTSSEFVGRYRPSGPTHAAAPGTLEHFLTERYCLYTVDSASRTRRLEIHHRPWALQGADAEIAVNTMASAAGLQLPSGAPLLHFSKRQDVVTYAAHRV